MSSDNNHVSLSAAWQGAGPSDGQRWNYCIINCRSDHMRQFTHITIGIYDNIDTHDTRRSCLYSSISMRKCDGLYNEVGTGSGAGPSRTYAVSFPTQASVIHVLSIACDKCQLCQFVMRVNSFTFVKSYVCQQQPITCVKCHMYQVSGGAEKCM